ncbi:MAG: ATP-binding protein [Pseudohongiella sp.]|nr:ATP-binding protein [Pseudohongiella sp.]MDO9520264.1 ATP-binding protein [Pseudohongiella sp.]MDP2127069.1 ATP-binding protein [Pseudohongiella sp.]
MKILFLASNLFIAVLLSVTIYLLASDDRERVMEKAYTDLELVATALQEHTQQTLRALDLNLSQLTLQALRIGLDTEQAREAMHQVAINRQTISSNTYAFYVIDSAGRVVVSSQDADPEPVDQSSTEEFLFHKATLLEPLSLQANVLVSKPRLAEFGSHRGQWVIPVSRRVPFEDGSFAGVAVALLSMEHLLVFYDAIRPDDGAVGLLTADSHVIARSPFEAQLMAIDITDTSQFIELNNTEVGGRTVDLTYLQNAPRISAFRYTWNDQLIVYANMSEFAALQDWRRRLVASVGIGGLIMALFIGISIGIIIVVGRQRQTVEAQKFALEELRARQQVEAQLRQSHKMDALGQLTGGIAHDFNNLLTVILGNIDDVLEHLHDKPEHIRSQADVIRLAGERAAELTHRLLAFARRQPLDPRATDVNELVAEVKHLLRRTVKENIQIELIVNDNLGKALVDPHELQNALINLSLNARDAMPDGGKLTIEAANIEVDEEYGERNQLKPGHYVVIAVSDTGYGIPADVLASVFDPFFTTKAEGKGSGLGLAMVYGFARQSQGNVKIYSETGEGTTVRLYLPLASKSDATIRGGQSSSSSRVNRGGSERVLLVEDDDLVRHYASASLKGLGYQVTECSNGAGALDLIRAGNQFDLLFTDVVLTGGISGKEVALEAVKLQPGLKVLYMSGYTENAIVHHGRLDPGVHLLSKPFRLRALAEKLRMVLDNY